MMRLAQFISVLGHPLFMPSYAFGLLLYTNPYINMMVPQMSKQFTFGILGIFTIILPLITAVVFKQFGLINSLFMKNAEERKWPFVLTLVWYYMGFQLLSKIYLPQSFLLLMIGATCAIGISLIINSRWKISIHMLGIGGVVGAIIGISQRFQYDHSLLVMGLILFAGLIGFARLKTNSHNHKQVYAGFLLGAAIEWMAVLYF